MEACEPNLNDGTTQQHVSNDFLQRIFQKNNNNLRWELSVPEKCCFLPLRRGFLLLAYLKLILAALNFYANGSYQRNIGASFLNSLSQPTFSKCLAEVTNVFNKPEILAKFIKFPGSLREREVIMQQFMEKFGFPGVIGCIDGTHVALIRPTEHEETYFNRKNYHSLNVLLVVNVVLFLENLRFLLLMYKILSKEEMFNHGIAWTAMCIDVIDIIIGVVVIVSVYKNKVILMELYYKYSIYVFGLLSILCCFVFHLMFGNIYVLLLFIIFLILVILMQVYLNQIVKGEVLKSRSTSQFQILKDDEEPFCTFNNDY